MAPPQRAPSLRQTCTSVACAWFAALPGFIPFPDSLTPTAVVTTEAPHTDTPGEAQTDLAHTVWWSQTLRKPHR